MRVKPHNQAQREVTLQFLPTLTLWATQGAVAIYWQVPQNPKDQTLQNTLNMKSLQVYLQNSNQQY